MNSGNGGFGIGIGLPITPPITTIEQGQSVAALVILLGVLGFIIFYCCYGAPCCRSFCRRYCCCRLEDPEPDTESQLDRSEPPPPMVASTPTFILLPHGGMLVVDGTLFSQWQADHTGLDLVEVGENAMRSERTPRCLTRHQLQNSTLEMDAETPSKDSTGSIGGFPPPPYESIYGKDDGELPPSYSDILLHRFANLPYEIELQDRCADSKENIEMHSLESCPHIISNPINNLAYHPYATITSFSSQSFPRRNISRNSSIISNPIDDFYIENEFGDIYTISHVPISNQTRQISNDELNRHQSDLNNLPIAEHVEQRHRDNTRVDIRNVRFQASVGQNGEVTLSIEGNDNINGRTSRQAMRSEDVGERRDGDDEEGNDFEALADIRESRV